MALRRRQKRTDQSKIDATPPWELRQRPEPAPTTGPYDLRDAPADDIARVDLGALRIPASAALELRLDLAENHQVISANLVGPAGQMQVGLFAAPRGEGIWDSVRTEIGESLATQGAAGASDAEGPFGTELVGKLRVDGALAPVRFIGVEGPRWFLRAMLVGAAATDSALAEPFEDVLRGVVVVRGSDPLPVREPVPMRLPKEAIPPQPESG
jgi:hypothetical protein